MQMLPVVEMCGHRCGLHITATMAIPLAVRTGLAFSSGYRTDLYFSGIAWMISTSFGVFWSLFLRESSVFICQL